MIIEWILSPNDNKTIANTDKDHNGRWNYGSPVKVAFRWPDSAETQPFLDDSQPFMAVDGQTVTYTYPGQWALFWLMRVQETTSADFTDQKDSKPNTLRFEIPNGPEEKTIIYNRIVLRKPGDGKNPGEPMDFPSFPTNAPKISQKVLSIADQAVIAQGIVASSSEGPEEPDESEGGQGSEEDDTGNPSKKGKDKKKGKEQ
jgi:type VI secretion system protein ImpL